MKVLMITGDRRFGPGNERYELQHSTVEAFDVAYWGRSNLWPKVGGHYDVVTVQDPLLRGVFAWRAAKKTGARFNVQVHMDLQVLPWWKHMLAQIVLRHADSIRVVSQKIKEQVSRMGMQAPITVLPVFTDVARFARIPRTPEPKTVLWVGRFEEEKDPLLALDLVARIPGAKLIMLGKGSLEAKLRERAGGKLVEFPGWQDPAPYLARAAAVLSTSRYESYGASIIEALAAGVPVVSPDVGIAKEAGATVIPRSDLGKALADVLQKGERGSLRLALLDKEAWARAWKDSLV